MNPNGTFFVNEIEDIILNGHRDGTNGSLITILEDIQDRYHFLPKDALILVSERLGIPLSQTYSIATFYNAFSLVPKGKHLVSVCLGTACHVKGGGDILDKIRRELDLDSRETTEDLQFTVEEVRRRRVMRVRLRLLDVAGGAPAEEPNA